MQKYFLQKNIGKYINEQNRLDFNEFNVQIEKKNGLSFVVKMNNVEPYYDIPIAQ